MESFRNINTIVLMCVVNFLIFQAGESVKVAGAPKFSARSGDDIYCKSFWFLWNLRSCAHGPDQHLTSTMKPVTSSTTLITTTTTPTTPTTTTTEASTTPTVSTPITDSTTISPTNSTASIAFNITDHILPVILSICKEEVAEIKKLDQQIIFPDCVEVVRMLLETATMPHLMHQQTSKAVLSGLLYVILSKAFLNSQDSSAALFNALLLILHKKSIFAIAPIVKRILEEAYCVS